MRFSKTKRIRYTIYKNGEIIATPSVSVPDNIDSFRFIQERLVGRFGELTFNHPGKTATVIEHGTQWAEMES